ncbi:MULTISPECIES: hypothetical protein [unclassified Brevundimonas]|uniref:hypothetical protein n=1 Tax=unclassified Brevundimonas TaxID=2622653 RepID=UPI0025BD3F90|nr:MULTISPECIES: hypothetical protein [unclassified Brevundimonas]
MFDDPAAEEEFLAAMANRGFYVFMSPPAEAASTPAARARALTAAALEPASGDSESVLLLDARLAA